MQTFFEWFENKQNRPWLILGKGPSFSKRFDYDLNKFSTLSLNHAVRETKVDVAHIIDLDVIDSCKEAIRENAKVLVMPWVPHVNNSPGQLNLGQLVDQNSFLKELQNEKRLLWYNLSSAQQPNGHTPVVRCTWFSSEAALNLLAMNGVKVVRSLGVDGGAAYSRDFDDLKDKTLLSNGHKTFDLQFREIATIIRRTGVDYSPLDLESPVKIYVGTTSDQMLAVRVLDYSVKKYASLKTEIFPLHLSNIEVPQPKLDKNRPRTPFSFQRFMIPELSNYKGRAVYMDSDMQVFRDIRELWTLDMQNADVMAVKGNQEQGRRPQFSVMLIDCSQSIWNVRSIVDALDNGQFSYEQLMYEMAVAKRVNAEIGPEWNSLENFDEKTALLHYTDMPTQPWIYADHRFGYLWVRDLIEALNEGFIEKEFVVEEIRAGNVRPSLLYQIEEGLEDGLLLPAKARRLDKDFIAPFQKSSGSTARRSAFFARNRRYLYSSCKDLYRQLSRIKGAVESTVKQRL
jgi:hypothetical protein